MTRSTKRRGGGRIELKMTRPAVVVTTLRTLFPSRGSPSQVSVSRRTTSWTWMLPEATASTTSASSEYTCHGFQSRAAVPAVRSFSLPTVR